MWCVLTGTISANAPFSPSYLYTDLSWSSIHSHPQWGPGRGRKTPRGPMSVWGLHRGRGWSGEVFSANHPRAHGPGHALQFALTWPAGVNPARPGWAWHAVAGRVYWNSVTFVAERAAAAAGGKPWKESISPPEPAPFTWAGQAATCCYRASPAVPSPEKIYRCSFLSHLWKTVINLLVQLFYHITLMMGCTFCLLMVYDSMF